MTPMNRLSGQIKKIKAIVSAIGVSTVELNKTAPKFKGYGYRDSYESSYTKGVESDFIQIYKLSETKSFAFAYYFKTGDTHILATVKDREEIISSDKYSIDGFKDKLNKFVSVLQVLADSEALTLKSLESAFKSNFIKNNELDLTAAISSAKSKIEDRIYDLNKEHKQMLKSKEKLKQMEQVQKKNKEAKMKALKEKLNFFELQKKFHEAVEKIHAAEEKIDTTNRNESSELRKAVRNSYDYDTKRRSIIEEESRLLPRRVRDDFKKNFEE